MVAAVTDVVSLAAMKTELRIPLEEKSHDDMIMRQLTAAVAWVTQETGLPLVDTERTFNVWFPADPHDPLPLGTAYLRRLVSVAYWLAANPARGQPGGTIAVRTLLRVEPGAGGVYWCWPPVAGWPSGRRPNTPGRITIVEGLETIPAALAQAVIMSAREFYDAFPNVKPGHALLRLISAFRAYS